MTSRLGYAKVKNINTVELWLNYVFKKQISTNGLNLALGSYNHFILTMGNVEIIEGESIRE
jgi:hypothetical protein